MMSWRGRSRRTTCAMLAILVSKAGRGTLTSWWRDWPAPANHSYSPGLRRWLSITPGVPTRPAAHQQLLHGLAVSAQSVLSGIKHSQNLWLRCKNWVVWVLWASCGSHSSRVPVNLEGNVCSLLKGEHASDFSEVISFNTRNYAYSIQIRPVSDWLRNPLGLWPCHAITCAVPADPRDGTWSSCYSELDFPLPQLVSC